MKFIIGIGNEDKRYEETRHNIGFKVVNWIQAHRKPVSHAVRWSEKEDLKAFIARLDEDHFLIKSKLFVNNTGGTVSMIRERNPSAKPSDYLFVCDDVNLRFGKMRLRASGSAGGHHGLESVIQALGTEFPRLRIGVGNESMPKDDLTSFVLARFTAQEEKELGGIFEKAASVCESWMNEGFDSAMNCLSRLQS